MLFQFAVFAAVTAVISAANATCPQLPVTNNLDANAVFQGKWYPIAQSIDPKENGNCSVFEYVLDPNPTFTEITYCKIGMKISKALPFTVNSTVATITLPTFKINDVPISCYVYTDYDSYYVCHNCIQLPNDEISEFVAITVRESKLASKTDILSSLKDTLSKAGSKTELFDVNQEDCPR